MRLNEIPCSRRRQGRSQIRIDCASLALLLPSYVATSPIDAPRTRTIASTVKMDGSTTTTRSMFRTVATEICA